MGRGQVTELRVTHDAVKNLFIPDYLLVGLAGLELRQHRYEQRGHAPSVGGRIDDIGRIGRLEFGPLLAARGEPRQRGISILRRQLGRGHLDVAQHAGRGDLRLVERRTGRPRFLCQRSNSSLGLNAQALDPIWPAVLFRGRMMRS